MRAKARIDERRLLRHRIVVGHLPGASRDRIVLRELVGRALLAPGGIVGQTEGRHHPQPALGVHVLDLGPLRLAPDQLFAEEERRHLHRGLREIRRRQIAIEDRHLDVSTVLAGSSTERMPWL
jgi:hypothetical protein